MIVINLADNVAKSGTPGKAFSMDLNSISLKWIDVVLTRKDGKCSTTVYSDSKVIFDPQGVTHSCGLKDDSNNFFVVNSRSKGGSVYLSSFVTISASSWEQI